jgi:hypothetical protein
VSRPRTAYLLSFVALVAALVGAIGPAERVRTTYTWPPATMPDASPTTAWYTPLLLVRREPESLSARVPCTEPVGLAGTQPVRVLATARSPEEIGGLSLTAADGELVVRVGAAEIARAPLVATGRNACEYDLALEGRSWSLEGGPDGAMLSGTLETMPLVSGLFSEVDLRSSPAPRIAVTTAVHASQPTALQAIAWVVATLCGLAALWLLVFERRPRKPWAIVGDALRAAVSGARAVDLVVGAALLLWWVVSPAYYDDGWVVARQEMFSPSGGFSNYYDSFGSNLPLGYWLEWLQHWVTEATHALLYLRIPALLCLAGIWVLCRWMLGRMLASSVGETPVARWALASAFVAGAFAWGVTLRPEPAVALLVTGVLACTILFLERESVGALALAVVLVTLALTAHPAGIVSTAPLLVASPTLFRWARPRIVAAATLVTVGVAFLVVLAFVGSDMAQRRLDAQTVRIYGDATASWRDELTRYVSLSSPHYGPPIRRASVVLLILAVLAYVTRSRRRSFPLLDLPAASLAVGLVLLIATPSKWAWHFGTLVGLGAVAVAAETARLSAEDREARTFSVRALLAVGAAALGASWAWGLRPAWGDLDLQTMEWLLGVESRLTLSKLAGVLPALLLVALGAFELLRRGRGALPSVPWRVATWSAPLIVAPLVVFTAGVLLADAAKTESWTLTKQNVETLRGDLRCGAVDDTVVARTNTMRPLAVRGDGDPVTPPGWIPGAPIEGVSRFVLGGSGREPEVETPWFEARSGAPVGFFLTANPGPPSRLELQWGRSGAAGVEVTSAAEVGTPGDDYGGLVHWRFVPEAALPARPPDADAVRLVLTSDVETPALAVISGPVSYQNEPLSEAIERDGSWTLVPPNVYTYVPCATQPTLRDGIIPVPDRIVGLEETLWPILSRGTTPLDGMLDLYDLHRLPLADSDATPPALAVYEPNWRIPGAALAPADAVTVVS